jgi:hypothetical protein
MEAEVFGRLARVKPLVAVVSLTPKPRDDCLRYTISDAIDQCVDDCTGIGASVVRPSGRTRCGDAEVRVRRTWFQGKQPVGL